MLIHDDQYVKTIREMLQDAQKVSMAVAFWGAGSQSLFDHWQGKSLRIICNLALGGTNPAVIRELLARKNSEVRQLDNLHAKLVLTDSEMTVGSANISSNGLGLEAGEVAGFRELGILSRDARQLKAARAWFEELWKTSCPITETHLGKAQKVWAQQRRTRPQTRRTTNLLEQRAEDMRDRPIYLVVVRSGASEEAIERLRIRQEEIQTLAPSHRRARTKLDVYEGWEYPDLPKDPSAVIIPIYWGTRGKIEIRAPQRPIPELEESYEDDGEKWRLDFTAIISKPNTDDLLFPIKGPQQEKFVELIRRWLLSVKGRLNGAYDGLCVPVAEFLQWQEENVRQ